MARIVRHNDESVREGYIRNGAKEVKLLTRTLKAFQCNNRIVMAQRKHLDDFLRGRIIGRLECGRTQLEVSEELGINQSVISSLWQRFRVDGNVSRGYSTDSPRVTTPNEDRHTFGSYCQKKQTEHSIRPVSSALFGYRYDGYQTYGLASILTGLESNRACVEYALPTNCSPSTPSHLSTGTLEGIA
ncbi:uncharacterized protein TNCV_4780691 [Trichonephila clavipes]|nr:uncharacterized protein TNCV_4780691 [Trichonephila clavipes]